jgi:tetratricopeptide (TPR) repeat protein
MWAIAAALLVWQAADPASQGQKALDEGKYDAAVQALTEAIAADPKDYFSHFNLALAYTYLHRDAEGVAEYRKTLELRPGLYEAELNAAILLMRNKEPADALPLLAAAAAEKPAEFQPRFLLAEAQLQTGALDQAEGSFRGALGVNPQSGPAHLGMARTLARQEKLADAAPHFRQAAALDASLRNCLLELAALYEQSNQPAEAIAIYREFPGDAAAQKRMSELLLESNRYAEAASRLEQAYAAEPSSANRLSLAEAYVANRQFDKAIPLLEKAVAADASNCDLRMTYGRALRDSRQFPAAAAEFQEAAKLKPGDAAVWSELAASLSLAGDDARALPAFERAHDLGQDTPGNWFSRAMILDRLKQLKPALEAYQHFLSVSQGKFPDHEFQARQRVRIIQRELEKK